MAHPCFDCGGECYCNGSLDDSITEKTPRNCTGCGCSEDLYDDDDHFDQCAYCDGHDACADFGCAYDNGLGHLVNKELGGNPGGW